jgi:uncharacterized protein YdaU (DUF1376 family)
MKETFYFSHDYNARNDEKLLKLQKELGFEAIGIYWCMVEMLYEHNGFMKYDCNAFAYNLRIDKVNIIKYIIENYELFEVSNEKVSSKSILARLRKRKGKSEKARQSAFHRWNKGKEDNANAMRTQCDSNAIKERKGKDTSVATLHLQVIELFDYYKQEFKNKIHSKIEPQFSWGKCEKLAKPHIRKIGLDKMKILMAYYLSTKSKWYEDNVWSLDCFLTAKTINELKLKNGIE